MLKNNPRIVTNGLVGAWDALMPNTATAATKLYDAAGSNDGTMYNGSCLDFDGTDDYVEIATTYEPGNGNWALSMWINTDTWGTYSLMGNTSGGPSASRYFVGPTLIGFSNYDGAWQHHYGNTTLSLSTWYFCTWVNYAGSSSTNGTMKMFVNGVADSSAVNSYTTNGGRLNAIGQNTASYFDGRIADVRFYNVALSDANVKELYDDSKVIIPTKNDASGGFADQTNLKRWWTFAEGAGTICYDAVGYTKYATMTNMTSADWLTGQTGAPQLVEGYNRPMWFDGSSDYVSIADSATLSVGTTFTISYWFYPEDITTESYHVSKNTYTGNQKSYAVNQYSTGKTQFRISGNGSSHIECTGDTVMSNKAWHHIVHVFDGVAGTKLKGWVDGTAQTFNQQPNVTGPYDSTSILCLGTRDAGLAAPFAGILNEVIIYNSALDATDAAALYATGPNGGPLPPDPRTMSYSSSTTSANIMGYWRNDNNVTLTDLSGNSNTGTAIGSPDVLLFKQGSNGQKNVNTGRDNQGFPLLYQNNGAVGFTQTGGSNVTIPHSSDILWDINANFTIITWYKIPSNPSGTYPSIWGKGGQSESGPGYELFLNPSGTSFTLRATWSGGPTWGTTAAYGSAGNPMDGKWHCVAVTIDRDNPTTGGKLYQDNVRQSSVDISGVGDTTNTTNLTLGSAGAGLFHGQIAGAQIYNRALSDTELTQNFNAQRSRFGI